MHRLLIPLAALACACGGGGGDASDPGPACTPACDGKACGDDGCGGSCGDCGEGAVCDEAFQCVPDGCTPACDGRSCGDDGCGGSCGDCDEGWTCSPYLYRCVGGCTPACDGRVCGADGCDGSCGDCAVDQVCAGGACVAAASCENGLKDGTESDIDCGGPACPACPTGKACGAWGDCASGLCDGSVCVPDTTCKDGLKTGDETDVDCGGPKCDRCALGKYCKDHGDCLTEACIYGVCVAPTCKDGIRNQGEADVDCGGPCDPCKDGAKCAKDGDCANGHCVGWTCISCKDGIRNGDETDVDCGGPACPRCPNGKSCGKAIDCLGGGCEGGECCTMNACGFCGKLPTETCNDKDDDCDGKTDEGLAADAAPCPLQKGVCKGAVQACTKGQWACDAAAYKAHSSKYQSEESICDAYDNDCDGTADEGLKNACGACGAVPVETCNGQDDDCDGETDEGLLNACGTCDTEPAELCNGHDDDCDGETDEVPECASCQATPTGIEVSTTVGSSGTPYYWLEPANAMIANGSSAWIAYRKITTPAVLRLADGKVAQAIPAPGSPFVEGDGTGIPSVAAWGKDALFAYVRSYNGFHGLYVVPVLPAGPQTPVKLASGTGLADGWYTASAGRGSRALVLSSLTDNQGARWELFESLAAGAPDATMDSIKTFVYSSNMGKGQHEQLRLRSDGKAFRFSPTWPDSYGNVAWGVQALDGTSEGFFPGLPYVQGGVFQPRSDGLFAAIQVLDGQIGYRTGGDPTAWDTVVPVHAGRSPGLSIGPGDLATVTFLTDDYGSSAPYVLWEARQRADGTFASRQLATFPSTEAPVATMVAVDAAGRAHIVVSVMLSNYPATQFHLVYFMSCWNGG